MRVEVGAPVVLVAGVDTLWHITAGEGATLCGLSGDTFVYSSVIRRRRCCSVCRARHRGDLYVAELGPLPERRARGGGKPKGKHARVSDLQLEALYRAYTEQGLSVRQLADRVWEQLGYKTPESCTSCLHGLFRDRGYELRDRIEATVLASTKNGCSPRNWQDRKRRRKEAGLTQHGREFNPTCKAVKTQAPRKGTPCDRRAMDGSDFCFGHNPDREAQRNRMTADMRARLPRRRMLAWADVLEELTPWLSRHEYPAMRLAEETGVPAGTIHRLLKGSRDTITLELAERLLYVVDVEMAEAA